MPRRCTVRPVYVYISSQGLSPTTRCVLGLTSLERFKVHLLSGVRGAYVSSFANRGANDSPYTRSSCHGHDSPSLRDDVIRCSHSFCHSAHLLDVLQAEEKVPAQTPAGWSFGNVGSGKEKSECGLHGFGRNAMDGVWMPVPSAIQKPTGTTMAETANCGLHFLCSGWKKRMIIVIQDRLVLVHNRNVHEQSKQESNQDDPKGDQKNDREGDREGD